jgi:glycine betaine/proline transport system substrate-binding protein
MKKRTNSVARLALVAAFAFAASCGSDTNTESAPKTTTGSEAAPTNAPTAPTDTPAPTDAPTPTDAPATPVAGGAGIVLAVNPWLGSEVNTWVAKTVLESELGTNVEALEIDENAAWPALAAGDIDASLEVWPSGHAADYETYVTGQKSVVDMGLLGPDAKIGWYIPTALLTDHPELATWEGFKDPDNAKLFATAESGDLGQFLMGDPSYVSYDEQIIANLGLPLKFVVAGSEAALITAIQTAVADGTPLLLQFWKPHWLQLQVDLTEVTLPEVTDECLASAAAGDGKFACDYPIDALYKVASAGLEAKNPAAFAFLSKMQLTTEQQSEIAGFVERDGMDVKDAAKKWVDANPDVVKGWMG